MAKVLICAKFFSGLGVMHLPGSLGVFASYSSYNRTEVDQRLEKWKYQVNVRPVLPLLP